MERSGYENTHTHLIGAVKVLFYRVRKKYIIDQFEKRFNQVFENVFQLFK